MEKKIKVLHYIPGFNDGGIEARLLDWYKGIDKTRVEFVVVKMGDDLSKKAERFVELGGRFRNIPKLSISNFRSYYKSLEKVIRDENPQIIHVHCMNTGMFCLKIAKKLGIKTRILHSRTTNFLPDEKYLFVKKIIKKITPLYANVFFACSYEAGLWGNGKKNANKTVVIKNGIDYQLFNFDVDKRNSKRTELNIRDKKVIGTIGRLSSQKNLLFLIDVFNEIKRNDISNVYHLVIVGSGNVKSKLLEKVEEMGLKDDVTIIEAQQDVWNYYMAFDIFVGTSFYEGFGTTAIESQATGLPTILSTGFPKSIEISNYVKRLPLSKGVEYWADEILKTDYRDRTIADAENVRAHGYSSSDVAKMLEEFYLTSSKKYSK